MLLSLIGSIIAAIIFARVLAPLFIKAKNKLLARDYKDGYIPQTASPMLKKTMVKRMLYLVLLSFGFLSFLMPLVEPSQWLSPETICSYGERGIDPQYHFAIFLTLMGFVYPIAVGLWAISWAIEDSGLMHYAALSEDSFEIEPINLQYSSYLKGYAGISALMFAISFTLENVKQNTIGDGALILAVLLIAIVCFFPTYIIFAKVMGTHDYLTKGLEEFKKLNEEDIKK